MMDLLRRLNGVVRSGEGWSARCPAHDDQHNSLSLHHRDGRWLLHCHARCSFQAIVDALGIEAIDLFDKKAGAGVSTISLDKQASAQPRPKLEPAEAGLASKQNGTKEQRAG